MRCSPCTWPSIRRSRPRALPLVSSLSILYPQGVLSLRGRRLSSAARHPCYCYIEMSWGNCSVKVSSPYGDFHDEPEGVAPRRTGDCGRGRPDQQSGGSRRPAHDAPAISAAQAALSRDGGGGTAPPKPRAPLAATPAGERGGPSPGGAARPVHGVPCHAVH